MNRKLQQAEEDEPLSEEERRELEAARASFTAHWPTGPLWKHGDEPGCPHDFIQWDHLSGKSPSAYGWCPACWLFCVVPLS